MTRTDGHFSTHRLPLRLLAGLAIAALAAGAELAYQAQVLIPGQVFAEQLELARAIVRHWGADPQSPRDGSALEALPHAEISGPPARALNPDLHALALIDASGRIAHSTLPEWRGRGAAQTIADYAALADGDGGPSPAERTLVQGGRLRVLAGLAHPEPGPSSPSAGDRLYLELDLRRRAQAAWAARLQPSGWLPSLLVVALTLALTALLAELGLGRPLRRLASAVRASAGDRRAAATDRTPGALGAIADLTDGFDGLVQALEDTRARLGAHETRWRYALEGSGDGVWDWDMIADRVSYSTRWKGMLGYGEDEIGDGIEEWLSRVHPDDVAQCRSALERHRAGDTPDCICEHRLRAKDGTWLWFLERARIMERTVDGRPARAIGIHSNINDRKLAERSLAALVALETVLAETSRSLLAAQPEAVGQVADRVLGALARRLNVEGAGIFVLGPEGDELRMAHEWTVAETKPGQGQIASILVECLPRWMETLRHGEDVRIHDLHALPAAWTQDSALLARRGIRAAAAVPLRANERLGGFVAVHMESGPRHWPETELRALRCFADTIAAAFERRKSELELVKSRQRLEEVALYDTLTGLPNRRLLAERMREAMAAAEESGTQLAVCYLDLDRFKPINDTYGHAIGDRILIAAAARLRAQIRESDTVARLGGDELVLLMGGFDSLIECANFLDRLVKQLAQPYNLDGLELQVTASAGATLYPRDANDADTLLRHADHAMYQAKQCGRNRCRFFDILRDRRTLVRRSQLTRIGEAIEANELRLFYQPKVNMRSGRPIGAEALVRWQHPEQGLLMPRAFIPLMDGSDLQQRMDWWVLEHALRQLDVWRTKGLDLALSINISARSVQCEGFVEDLAASLTRHTRVPPDALSLEILESDALVDLDTVAQVIRQCQELGVRFALDDFGTGYSSLTYFRRLPAQVLKIDQTFVRDMLRCADDRSIVEGVIGLAHAFQREVIAEGVESAAHGLMLLHMGCEHAQGYGVAEPMPPERLLSWVASYSSPSLWSLRLPPPWSCEDPDLFGLESAHRAWVARLVRSARAGASTRSGELDKEHAGLGRWLQGQGRRQYGHLEELKALEEPFETVHARARDLIGALGQGSAAEAEIAPLLEARERFVGALHRLQERVLTRGR